MSLRRLLRGRRTLAIVAVGSTLTLSTYCALGSSRPSFPPPPPGGRPPPPWNPPSRKEMVDALRANVPVTVLKDKKDLVLHGDEEYDLLVVGGGAVGAGVVLDAATRGLKVALVEREDFSSGASSKSTKLVHGGVRYLQKAILELDYEQYKLVREALHERRIFLQTAPYLSHMLPIMLPIYKWWQLPYYYVGCKAYDFLAGSENMESSYVMSKGKALDTFPMLKSDGLVGALVYYDGQHNDARMNLSLIMTAVQHGATVANHTEVIQLHKNPGEPAEARLSGARVRDRLTGEEFNIRAKGVINATGPFSDTLLQMDTASTHNSDFNTIVQPSSGVHVTLPNYYSPEQWGNTIAGTTDTPVGVQNDPVPREEDIQWILEEIRRYLSPDIKVRRGDVLSAWSGLRPLIRDPNSPSSADLVRSHLVHISASGLLTVAGGKWTTYRAMARDAVDAAVKEFKLEKYTKNENGGACMTEKVRLVGSEGWSKNMFIGLIQRYGLETEVAKHLAATYGDRAWAVASMAEASGQKWPLHGVRINPNYPYIEAEIRYATRVEYCQTAVDFIARRSRLSFLNATAALDALPYVIDTMAGDLGWDDARRKLEWMAARTFLVSMAPRHLAYLSQGLVPRGPSLGTIPSRAHFSLDELETLKNAFISHGRASTSLEDEGVVGGSLDASQVLNIVRTEFGFGRQAELSDVKRALRAIGVKDAAALGTTISFDEFVDAVAHLKDRSLRVASLSSLRREHLSIPVEKSGGGV
ncbi:hypothetical protein BS47DRAFT_1373210 [Hydnum rufescens UP504]|uniref:glycerol-3-phosphate dehydrogenase n=1 Tax=Hydnum rufescens UP504 TaxID=1448309 RepID=A0A9P6DTV9_9AGAM|nr:hypothetical protein BS47DRAFT_1373210 [Hydnum rufescens UP504]